jgi:nicotinate phosphoribosyltransferase
MLSHPRRESALLTDLYELTMAQAYFRSGMQRTAVFELFARRLPPQRRFLIAAGLEQLVEYLEEFRFTPEDIDFLAGTHLFGRDFLDYLVHVRFTGSVHAMSEGTPFFENEPIVRITAPILEAQLIESRLMNIVHFQTLIASKAIRCVIAARGKRLVDFGMRRAHGAEAALLAARAAYLAGFDSTATVEAGRRFGMPLTGTMAHSFIEAHDKEVDGMRNFITSVGRRTSVLIDTYDTERATHRLLGLCRELTAAGEERGSVGAVRIDSGDLAAQAAAVRRILDEAGRGDIEIVLSGGLNEHEIEHLLDRETPVDSFGVGTSLDVSSDAPALDMAYKLEEYDNRPRRKRSPGKRTWPGAKQVFRQSDESGIVTRDYLALATERLSGVPLLEAVVENGKRIVALPTLAEARKSCRQRVAELPPFLLSLRDSQETFDVRASVDLQALVTLMDHEGD